MNEDEKLTPQDGPEPETGPEDRAPSPPRTRSVFLYLAIMFGVAFLLLLFAYLMQQRDSQEIMGNLSQLRESMGSIESMDQLVEENHQLRDEIKALEEELAELERDQAQQSSELTALQEKAEQDQAALEAAQARVQELEDELEALRGESEPLTFHVKQKQR